MRKKLYMSIKYPSLMIGLVNPERFGKFAETNNDFRPIRFNNFRFSLDLDNEFDKEVDEIMMKHTANIANGGLMFRAQTLEEEAVISKVEKGTFAKVPEDGYDEKIMDFLVKVSENVKGHAKKDIFEALNAIKKSLNVVGLPKYTDKSTAKSLGATATVLLDILEDNGIDYGRKTDPGGSTQVS